MQRLTLLAGDGVSEAAPPVHVCGLLPRRKVSTRAQVGRRKAGVKPLVAGPNDHMKPIVCEAGRGAGLAAGRNR
jgi:hypothetical protein